MDLKVVVETSEDGRYFIYVPSLPGVITEGDTEAEAMGLIRDAVHNYLEPSDEDLPVAHDAASRRARVRTIEL